MANVITEAVKKFFKPARKYNPNLSIKPDEFANKIVDDTSSNVILLYNSGVDNSRQFFTGEGEENREQEIIAQQNAVIDEYNKVSMLPEVQAAIDEIITEMLFVTDNLRTNSPSPISLNFRTGCDFTEETKQQFLNSFHYVLNKIIGGYDSLAPLVRRFYVWGQLNLLVLYDKKNLKRGIIGVETLTPKGLIQTENNDWKYVQYLTDSLNISNRDESKVIQKEELVHIDSGIYTDDGIILSDLHSILKVANQLQNTEDAINILRFSRSSLRRVFNIDVGNLPYKKAEEAVEKIKNTFKYDKNYNSTSGKITNQNTVISLVEDYFIANRNNTKGSSIDVLDEGASQLKDLDDLNYFKKKLYEGLKVPVNRLLGDNESKIDFTGTQIENSEIKFFSFVSQKRRQISILLLELVKRHFMLSQGKTIKQYETIYEPWLEVAWLKDSMFVERQAMSILGERIDLYEKVKDYIGDIYSKKYVLNNILKLSDEDIKRMQDEIVEEGSKNEPETNDEFGGPDENVGEGEGSREMNSFSPDTPEPSSDEGDEDNEPAPEPEPEPQEG